MPQLPSGRYVGIQTPSVAHIAHRVWVSLSEQEEHRFVDAVRSIKTSEALAPFVVVLFFRETEGADESTFENYHARGNRPQVRIEPYQSGFSLADWGQFTAGWEQADKDAFQAFLAGEGVQNYLQETLIQLAVFGDGKPVEPSTPDWKNEDPSPFYALFEGARDFTLGFPVDEDGTGPFWHPSGELDLSACKEQSEEEVELLAMGEDSYRLACRHFGPFSTLRLHWGDEFIAKRADGNKLILSSVVMPQKFRHYRFIASGTFKNENPIARVVHRYGGGWETVAVGMLTLTVPAHAAARFEQEMDDRQLIPGIFQLSV